MRKEHEDQILKWAQRVRAGKWREIHAEFINAQFDQHASVLKNILKEPNGKQKVKVLFRIENENGYSFLKEKS